MPDATVYKDPSAKLFETAKACAHIYVDGIIAEYDKIMATCYDYDRDGYEENVKYWQQVKQSI